MDELGYTPRDYAMVIFHQPNSKFPRRVAQRLGFTEEQLKPGFLVEVIGNAYAGSSPLGFAAALDEARPGDRILLVSFGSGAGSDALSFTATERILKNDDSLRRVKDYITRRQEID
jgi:hydroxymethylglutaryl-CoA synthase